MTSETSKYATDKLTFKSPSLRAKPVSRTSDLSTFSWGNERFEPRRAECFRENFVKKGAEHVTRTSNSSQLPEQTLCGTSDDAENGMRTSNSIKFAERRCLWSEQRRRAERFPVDFLAKWANLGNARTRRIRETDGFQNEHVTLFLRNGRIAGGEDERFEYIFLGKRMIRPTPRGAFSREFHQETVALSNSTKSVTMFWRNEQIRRTNKPAERATTPSGAFSRGFWEQAAELQNGGVWNSQRKRENPGMTASGAFRTGFVK